MAVAQRIYAEALFDAAKDAGKLPEVHEALADFAAAEASSPELRAVLRNPQLEPSAKAAILADSTNYGQLGRAAPAHRQRSASRKLQA